MPGPSLTNPKGIDHFITVAAAAAMTVRFRVKNPGGVRAWLFDREAFDKLLAQPGCAGIRIYRALKEDGSEQVVVVGTDANANDLLPRTVSEAGLVAEIAWPCPPMCGGTSVLGG
jgi:hypothetical protein